MAEDTLRKTGTMRLLERMYPGRSIEEIIREALAREPTPEAAAVALGVSYRTLWRWQQEFKRRDAEARQPAEATR